VGFGSEVFSSTEGEPEPGASVDDDLGVGLWGGVGGASSALVNEIMPMLRLRL
jgi:hypothetical protein